MKSKIAFMLISMVIFLFGCAPIAQIATETPVPPTATATSTETATATATEAPTATATEASTYKVCPPETVDPSECPIDLTSDLLSGRYADWASDLKEPFPSNITPIPIPLQEQTNTLDGIKYITFYGLATYFGGADTTLAVQKGATSARLVLPSGQTYDVFPFYLQDPNTKQIVTLIGYVPINGPSVKLAPQMANQNARNFFTSVAVPGVAEGYQYPGTGNDDELTKIIFNADSSMPGRIKDAIANGNIAGLDKKSVLIVLLKK
jgi:hypothetical protein